MCGCRLWPSFELKESVQGLGGSSETFLQVAAAQGCEQASVEERLEALV